MRTEVTGVTGRGLGMTGRVRSVVAADWHGKLVLRTGASGQAPKKLRNTRGRSDVSGRVWVLTRIDRTLALWRPVSFSSASGRVVSNANQWRPDA
jgi:hypothetical protein